MRTISGRSMLGITPFNRCCEMTTGRVNARVQIRIDRYKSGTKAKNLLPARIIWPSHTKYCTYYVSHPATCDYDYG